MNLPCSMLSLSCFLLFKGNLVICNFSPLEIFIKDWHSPVPGDVLMNSTELLLKCSL